MKMTDKDKQILTNLYDSQTWQVFRKHFLADRQMELLQLGVFQQTMELVAEYRGRIAELRTIDLELERVAKKTKQQEANNGKKVRIRSQK